MECYVDDIAVKSHAKGDHIADLKVVFDIMRAHQLKMNPTKSFLGVASGKFLGFVVTSKGSHLDPEKVRAVHEMQPPRNLRELRGLQGQLAYIWRFISNLSGRCQPFAKLMKKGVSFIWDDACQQAFEEINQSRTSTRKRVFYKINEIIYVLMFPRYFHYSIGSTGRIHRDGRR